MSALSRYILESAETSSSPAENKLAREVEDLEREIKRITSAIQVFYRGYDVSPEECPEDELTTLTFTPRVMTRIHRVLDWYERREG